ncbi:MAG: InlB B-repeat-containing protein, partial [Lachnospiraceae bacterium]|nr:InlB B-repeat-containing protein [Lachnospiraceae bacterium]
TATGTDDSAYGLWGSEDVTIDGNSTVEASGTSGIGSNIEINICENVKSVIAEGDIALGGKLKNLVTGTGWEDSNNPPILIDIHDPAADLTSSFKKVCFPQAVPTITTLPTSKDLTADGSEQELITAGTAVNGVMEYALGTSDNVEPETDTYGTAIPKATAPRIYYVWYRAVGTGAYGVSVPECITVEIKQEYTVTVTNDGNGTASASPVKGVTGTEVTLSYTPADGYGFKEWSVISGGVTVANNKFDIGTSNVTLKAIFERLQCTVSFDANGGSGTMADVKVDMNSEYTLPECTFTAPEGKEFEKWDKGAPGTAIKITEATTIKAVWKDKADSGSGDPSQGGDPSGNNGGDQPPTNDPQTPVTQIDGTVITKLTGKRKSITAKWKQLSDVDGYELQYTLEKDFSKGLKKITINDAKANSTTIKNLAVSKTYYVRIRAFKNVNDTKIYSDWSGAKKAKTAAPEVIKKDLPTTEISGLVAKKGAIKVIWKKQKGIDGYEIGYCLNKKFNKNEEIVTISKASTKNKTIKNLERNKKYYVRIRTFKGSGKKRVYSKWSGIKNVKTKK